MAVCMNVRIYILIYVHINITYVYAQYVSIWMRVCACILFVGRGGCCSSQHVKTENYCGPELTAVLDSALHM